MRRKVWEKYVMQNILPAAAFGVAGIRFISVPVPAASSSCASSQSVFRRYCGSKQITGTGKFRRITAGQPSSPVFFLLGSFRRSHWGHSRQIEANRDSGDLNQRDGNVFRDMDSYGAVITQFRSPEFRYRNLIWRWYLHLRIREIEGKF